MEPEDNGGRWILFSKAIWNYTLKLVWEFDINSYVCELYWYKHGCGNQIGPVVLTREIGKWVSILSGSPNGSVNWIG